MVFITNQIMMNTKTVYVGLLFWAMTIGCSAPSKNFKVSKNHSMGPPKVSEDEPNISGELFVPRIFIDVGDVEKRCAMTIQKVREQRAQFIALGTEGGVAPVERFNRIEITLNSMLPFTAMMANVHPNKELRDAAEKCQRQIMDVVTELSLDVDIYNILAKVDAQNASAFLQRSLDKQLKQYRRSGANKDAQTRQQITQIRQSLVKTAIDFSKEIREGTKYIAVLPEELVGLPEDFLAAHETGEDGKIRLSTDYPDFFPVVNYAQNEQIRRQMYRAFLQRAWPANEENLKKLLSLRFELAQLLGYTNWADMAAEQEMAKNGATIEKFIQDVAQIAKPRMQRDLQALLARKKQDISEAVQIDSWDRFYYVNKIKEEQFDIDPEALRIYFPFQRVLKGVLAMNESFFGVVFQPVKGADKWHSDVIVYDVLQGEQRIGRFFLDMHPREGKYKHMAMFHVVDGVSDVHLPVGALVCNFPKPSKASPALMEHSDVVTLFHEFGHLMHHILAGAYKWINLTGISCESEFVEAPSQLLEEWAFDYPTLKTFARHHETGEPIPKQLVEKLRESKEFGKGIHIMRQMFYAAMSLYFHSTPPDELDLLALTQELQLKYNPYPYEPETYVYASFGHLNGYSSEYYSYMWSLKLAKDLMTRFEVEGMSNPSVAADYRDDIIRRGGAEDAQKMIERFLGRPSNFDAFRNYLEH